MSNTINADDGIISGVAGLKYSADTSGALVLQTNGTTAITISASQVVTFAGAVSLGALTTSGSLTFTGTSNRITGNFSTADSTNVLFQTSTANSATYVGAVPSGTSTTSGFVAWSNNTASASASYGAILTNGTVVGLFSDKSASGTYLPMTFYTGGSERLRIDTSGNVGIGTASPNITASGTALTILGSSTNRGNLEIGATTAGTNNVFGQIGFYNGANYNALIQAVTDGTNADSGILKFFTKATAGAITERMRIDSSGNVIVGNTSYVTAGVSTGVVASTALVVGGQAAGADAMYVRRGGSAITQFQTTSGGASTGTIDLQPYGGSVGIGTDSPSYKFDVVGSGRFQPPVANDQGFFVTSAATSVNHYFDAQLAPGGGAYSYLRFAFGGNNIITWGNSLSAYASNFTLNSPSGALIFSTSSTERMRIDSSGNVGIGTSSPANLVEISSTTDTQVRITTTNTGKIPVINFNNSGGSVTSRIGQETSAGNAAFTNSIGYDLCIYAASSKGISIGNSGNLFGRFDSGSNFLVGGGNTVDATAQPRLSVYQPSGTYAGIQIQGPGGNQGAPLWTTIVQRYPVVSTGNALIIPFVAQGNLNSNTIVRVRGMSAQYNQNNPRPFTAEFACGHLSAIYNLTSWGLTGTCTSVTNPSGMNIQLNLNTTYTSATSNGVYVVIEYLTNVTAYSINVGSVAMN